MERQTSASLILAFISVFISAFSIFVCVHGFKGSEVQGSIFVPVLHLERVFMKKALSSAGLIQNLEPNWQLLDKMTMFNEDCGYSMPSLPLTLNVEP
jgi:hypothetical protein